jgi:hypothetical protein
MRGGLGAKRARLSCASRRGGGSSVGRAPGCGPGGRGFESHPPPLGPVAQRIERRTSNPRAEVRLLPGPLRLLATFGTRMNTRGRPTKGPPDAQGCGAIRTAGGDVKSAWIQGSRTCGLRTREAVQTLVLPRSLASAGDMGEVGAEPRSDLRTAAPRAGFALQPSEALLTVESSTPRRAPACL